MTNRRRWETLRRRYWGVRPWTRHSLVLFVAGVSFIAIGVSLHYYTPGAPRWQALIVARNIMSLDYWGMVFAFVGSLVILSASWPIVSRMWGYMLLTGLSAGWSMVYFTGMIVLPGRNADYLSSSLIWALQGFIWWAISGLNDAYQVHDGKS